MYHRGPSTRASFWLLWLLWLFLAIVGIQTIGAQGGPAAEPGYTVTFRALTEAEWTELDPLTAASGAAVTEWTDDDQLLPQGSLRVTWTTPPGAPPALKFHVDRRFHYSGNESEWTRVKSNNKRQQLHGHNRRSLVLVLLSHYPDSCGRDRDTLSHPRAHILPAGGSLGVRVQSGRNPAICGE